jgi:hypothetical protein
LRSLVTRNSATQIATAIAKTINSARKIGTDQANAGRRKAAGADASSANVAIS